MRIAVVVEKKLEDGGGFQQALNSILSLNGDSSHNIIVFNNQIENEKIFSSLGISFITYQFNVFQKIVNILFRSNVGCKILSRVFRNNYFEKLLKNNFVDFVYFVNPSYSALDCVSTPYGFTVWDLCHLMHPEFIEVREEREFELREDLFSKVLPKASFVIADSIYGKKFLIDRYRLQEDKIIVQYFEPSVYIYKNEPKLEVLEKYKLTPDFYFYPAQFWAHKNHKLILKALKLIKNDSIRVVFSGSNKGSFPKLKEWVEKNNLSDRVIFLGFVPNEDLSSLYFYSKALIMPSFFGPSNIPPLEAYIFNRPIIYTFPDFLHEIIPDYEHVYGISHYDPHELVEAISAVEKKSPERKRNNLDIKKVDFEKMFDQIQFKITDEI